MEDARETVDGWNVKVSMSAFAAAGHTSFDGMVTLANGTADNAYTSAITPIEITSGLGNANVATSQAEAGRGIFTIKWNAASDVQLSLSEAEALKVETASYSAELIWTLAATPSL